MTGLMLAGSCDYWTNINKLNHLLVRMSRNWLASSGYLVPAGKVEDDSEA